MLKKFIVLAQSRLNVFGGPGPAELMGPLSPPFPVAAPEIFFWGAKSLPPSPFPLPLPPFPSPFPLPFRPSLPPLPSLHSPPLRSRPLIGARGSGGAL